MRANPNGTVKCPNMGYAIRKICVGSSNRKTGGCQSGVRAYSAIAKAANVRTLFEAIEQHAQPEPNSGCLLWLLAVDKDGYARVWVDGQTRHAARAVFECVSGSIPSGMVIDHKCRVRCCVNPAHLQAVTQRENVIRGISPEVTRIRHARVTHCQQGHEYTPENTYSHGSGRHCRECTLKRQRLNRRRLKWRAASILVHDLESILLAVYLPAPHEPGITPPAIERAKPAPVVQSAELGVLGAAGGSNGPQR